MTGLSDRGEYIAGTFALLFEDGLNFSVVKVDENRRAELTFLAIDGKSYRIESSGDLKTWVPVAFSLPNAPGNPSFIYRAAEVQEMVVIAEPAETTEKVIYRLIVD